MDLKRNQTFIGHSVLPLPQHILQAGQTVGKGFCGYVSVQVSLFIACESLFANETRTSIGVRASYRHQLCLSAFDELCGFCPRQ